MQKATKTSIANQTAAEKAAAAKAALQAAREAAAAAAKAANEAAAEAAATAAKAAIEIAATNAKRICELVKAGSDADRGEIAALAAEIVAANRKRQPSSGASSGVVNRPKAESLCGQLWAAYDAMLAEGSLNAKAVAAYAEANNINMHTAKTQYARFKTFNGLTSK